MQKEPETAGNTLSSNPPPYLLSAPPFFVTPACLEERHSSPPAQDRQTLALPKETAAGTKGGSGAAEGAPFPALSPSHSPPSSHLTPKECSLDHPVLWDVSSGVCARLLCHTWSDLSGLGRFVSHPLLQLSSIPSASTHYSQWGKPAFLPFSELLGEQMC